MKSDSRGTASISVFTTTLSRTTASRSADGVLLHRAMRLLSDEMSHILEHLQRGARLIGPVTVS